MNIFITGATGFIGKNLVPVLLNKNNRIIALKRKTSDIDFFSSFVKRKRMKFYDVEENQISEIMKNEKINLVIHLATYYKKTHDFSDVKEMITSNIRFPTEILQSMISTGVKYIINTGTFFEFSLKLSKKIEENSIINPYNLYASTKVAFENILRYYTSHHGIKAVTLKLFAPYGLFDKKEKIIPLLIRSIFEEKSIKLKSSGNQKWDYIFSQDVARAYLKTIDWLVNNHSEYEIFNIASGVSISLKEIVDIIEKSMQKKSNFQWREDSTNEIKYVSANLDKANKILDWYPKISMEEGIKRTMNWLMANYMENNL